MRKAINEPIQLICFDLDGTITDSEPLHQRAKERLVQRLGYQKEVCYADFVGKPNHVFWAPIIADLNLADEATQSLEQKQYDLILEMAKAEGLQATVGLNTLLDYAMECGIRLAVCSSSNRYYVERVLKFLDLSHYFEFLLGGDDVANKKPAPDVYLNALELCGVMAPHAVAVEDSSAGVASAASAGISCIGYRNPTSGNQDLSQATMTVDYLEDILQYIKQKHVHT